MSLTNCYVSMHTFHMNDFLLLSSSLMDSLQQKLQLTMKNGDPLDLKVAAAAKLVLQELDPIAKQKRQDFSNGQPQALLAIHAKTLRNFSKTFFFTSTFAGCSDIRLFLRITVQGTVKCSKIVHIRRDAANTKTKLVMNRQTKLWSRRSLSPGDRGPAGPSLGRNAAHRDSLASANAEITLDELKIFSLDIFQRNDDARNIVKFELIEVDSQTAGSRRGTLNVGIATLHMYELIKELYGNKFVPMMVKDKKVADVDLEYVFRYGPLGYGYSHQLEQKDHSISSTMSESLFFRINPPEDRKDEEGFLDALEIPRPDFIPFVVDEKSKLSFPSSSSLIFPQGNVSNVTKLINSRKRLARMRKEYLDLSTRYDRTRYLETLVAKLGVTNTESGTGGDDEEDDEHDPDDGSPRQLAGMALDSRRQSEAVKVVVENLSPLLLMAPGLQSRGQRSGVVNRRATLDQYGADDSEASDEGKPESTDSRDIEVGSDAGGRASSAGEKKGLMKILRRKVLAPMRMKRLMESHRASQSSEVAVEITPPEEEQPTQLRDIVQRLSRGSASSSTPASLFGRKRSSSASPERQPDEKDS